MRDEWPEQAPGRGWGVLDEYHVAGQPCLDELAGELLAVRSALEDLSATPGLAEWHLAATRAALAEVDEAERILDRLRGLHDMPG